MKPKVTTRWPRGEEFRNRYFVPDLSPEQRPQLHDLRAEVVFVAESPHEAETASERLSERRPLCGRAGQAFWKMIGELTMGVSSSDTDLERLLSLARRGRFAVMNAVQFPLDPKITLYYGDAADPVAHLGFSKAALASFKKLKSTAEVEAAVSLLGERLVHESVRHLPVISLGNDAQWFVNQALGEAAATRHLMTVPHPSAWWRQGGKLRERARAQLKELLAGKIARPSAAPH